MAIADPRQGIEQVHTLLQRYFDTDAYPVDAVVADWLQQFDLAWVHNALIEALYQGRYKLVSIEQILRLWQRRGHPLRHYSREFESIIYGQTLLFSNAPLGNDPSQVETSHPEPEPWPLEESANPEAAAPPDVPAALTLANEWDNPFDTPTAEPTPPREWADSPDAALLASGIAPFQPTGPLWEKPADPSQLTPYSRQDSTSGYPEPIRTFVPAVHPSDLHERLQAVARNQPAPPASEVIGPKR